VNEGLLRSAFSGQGNAILVSPRFAVRERHTRVLNPESFRRAVARRLRLGLVARLAWAKERRVCQVVRLQAGERSLLVANLHATSYPPDDRLPDAELRRAFAFIGALASADDPVVVAGDFNVTFERSRTLQALTAPESGFSRPGAGIDHIVVRGCDVVSGPTPWPLERREYNGVRISDHAPVEVVLA
jgi:endonuclease/exonuclease/phosphatase family metal-dependent hydrolase